MPRLFIAIDLPEELRLQLERLREDTFEARWTPPEQYHLTLCFIGDVTPDRAGAVEQALTSVRAEPVTLRMNGLDVFPSRRKPRVLVVPVAEAPGLRRLHHQIETALLPVGQAPEVRPFNPHITLARLKRVHPQQVRAYLHARAGHDFGSFTARAFHLYESLLQSDGALHRVLASFPLS